MKLWISNENLVFGELELNSLKNSILREIFIYIIKYI